MRKNKVILFNPKSARWKHGIPNSILQIGASIYGKHDFDFVDGSMEEDPWLTISQYLGSGNYKYFGCTVMPGPQLRQAIPFSKKIKESFPEITIIWGGYFASNHYKTVMESGYVDYVINGSGDIAFPNLLNALETKLSIKDIGNLIFIKNGKIEITPKDKLLDQDNLPALPYEHLGKYYTIKNYISKTFLGSKTIGYHSSVGCPFSCSFCGVVPIYNGNWKGKSAENLYADIKRLKDSYNIDSVEFHDNNFFASRKRAVEFSKLIVEENIKWWGEGRIDTIDKYSDDDLKFLADSGCKMIFLGAETGSDNILKQMNKGGTQSAKQIKEFAARLMKFNIIPEYSFVLGLPADNHAKVSEQIDDDISFIKEIKRINPNTEIIIYLYSPVPNEDSGLNKKITDIGFKFPENLEEWLNPSWENFDLRKNPLTPWLTSKMVDKIKDFEVVLNGYYPTATDFKITGAKKKMLKGLAWWRYKTGVYNFPYEIRLLHKIWKYRQPEIEGFRNE